MSWMNWFFKRKGSNVEMNQDATSFSGDVTISGTATLDGPLVVSSGLSVTGETEVQGIMISASDGSPEAAVTGVRKGDLCVDYTNANLYVFAGTAGENTGWKLVTKAA